MPDAVEVTNETERQHITDSGGRLCQVYLPLRNVEGTRESERQRETVN